VSNHIQVQFSRGWQNAIAIWRSGVSLQEITAYAKNRQDENGGFFANGMLSCVDTINGWTAIGRRSAELHGLDRGEVDKLVASTWEVVAGMFRPSWEIGQ
jgi:hypothetical protein